MESYLTEQLREQRISYQPKAKVTRLEGENALEAIYFNKEGEYGDDIVSLTEYFVKPDMVICENGIGRPRQELIDLVGHQDSGSNDAIAVGGMTKIPHVNTRFSLIHNDIASPIHGVGAAVEFPSFVQK